MSQNDTVSIPRELGDFLEGRSDSLRVFKSGPASQVLLARELLARGSGVVMAVPGAGEFRELEALLQLFEEQRTSVDPMAPDWERPWIRLPSYLPKRPSAADWGARWAALYALTYGRKPAGVLLCVDNLLPRWPHPDILRRHNIVLRRGEEMSPELLREQAVTWGYVARPLVSGVGEMHMRGDILDIYAPGYPLPMRLEFFGDTLEDIRLFDPSSQRSKADLTEVVLLPVAPAVLASDATVAARKFWKKLRTTGEISPAEQHDLDERVERSDGMIFPGLFEADAVGLEEYIPSKSVWVLSGAEQLRARLEDQQGAWRDYFEAEARDTGLKWPQGFVCRGAEGARGVWSRARQVAFEALTIGHDRNGADLAETAYSEFGDIFWKPENARRPWSALVEGLKEWGHSGWQTILSFRTERARKKFLTLAEREELPIRLDYAPDGKGVFALVSPVRRGMELSWRHIRILGEDVLQPGGGRAQPRVDKAFEGLARYDDLQTDDLLVHRDYGLSRFGGLHHLKIGEAPNDYLLLLFDGDDKLYLPVDRLNLVQRYKGPEGVAPVLDQLGGSRWRKTTERARKAIEKIASELVEMYAFRRVAKGYGYGPVDDMYREFEATFGFEETPGQEQAIADVFKDMERSEPMDRLVCGDVGFGKTEVAMRAVFRCVSEGRQAALLCPTTVLAEQHYQNFAKRFEGFPLRVEMLSRFVPPKRQKAVVEAASRGEVDVLIGTHRMLSKDVVLPDLGLLVLDEEQRFGVKHKERLKHFRKNIDVLTLTATPIPRTLQLSLSGLRGLSVIETPPVDRKPVETALVERDDDMLRAILDRELARGGQVFWVHNRVQGLERVVEYVQSLVPHARVGMAHGQMTERTLENAVHGFWHHELDILVTTAIIESGLDFPNANTLIVDQAQNFGLGQLYQLRGRVGRSERQAYAYFIVNSVEHLPELARRRLRIILDMDYLGAGFKVAMEDLRLRGAGNILGEVQSGQIAKVGLDLFLEMLEEEVRRQRGGGEPPRTEPELNFVFEAHIPGDYVADPRERLQYYKALSTAQNEPQRQDVEAELRDRFGPLPEPLENFLGVLAIKGALAELRVARADLYPARAVLSWDEHAQDAPLERLMEWAGERSGAVRLLPPARVEIRYDSPSSIRKGLDHLLGELDRLLPGETKES